jgi:hypothetical protein
MCGIAKEVGKLAVGLIPGTLLGQEKAATAPATNPAAEQAAADAKAAQDANSSLAAKNKRRSTSILSTGAGDTGVLNTATGIKTTLGS